MVDLSDYRGREQSYVKHVFLESYLERLVHKTASAYSHIVYVDGFAGPWQSANETFEDTSFGIALNALRRAKSSWKERSRDVRMSAFLVERDPDAFKRLAQVSERYRDIAVKTYEADFISVLPKILKDIPSDAFAFFLIDPKGWRISLNTLMPMLARQKSEVIFNFMFEFINRAASIKDNPAVIAGLNKLMPLGNWRARLETAERPDERKAILIEGFAANLTKLGDYKYVAETTIFRPVKDRALYCLFYATRHEKGIEVFRDCQAEALRSNPKRGLRQRSGMPKSGPGK
jgi:three-Cys-motif partner protein